MQFQKYVKSSITVNLPTISAIVEAFCKSGLNVESKEGPGDCVKHPESLGFWTLSIFHNFM
jgi:hypothetical protein